MESPTNAQIQKLEAQAQELLTQIEELKLHSSSSETSPLMNPLLPGALMGRGWYVVADAGRTLPESMTLYNDVTHPGFRTEEKAEKAAKLYKQFTEVLAYLAETPVVRAKKGEEYFYLPVQHSESIELTDSNHENSTGTDSYLFQAGDYFLKEQTKTLELMEQLIRDMLAYRPRP